MTRRRSIWLDGKFWFGVVVSVVAMYYAFRGEDFGAVYEAMKRVNWLVLFLVAPMIWGGVAIRAARWHYLIRDNTSTFRDRYNAIAVGFLVTSILPLRLGEFVRMFVLARRMKRSNAEILATIAVERLFDLLAIAVLFALVLPFVPFDRVAQADGSSEIVRQFTALFFRFPREWLMIGSFTVVAAALAGFVLLCHYGRRITLAIVRRFGLKEGKILRLLESLFDGLEALWTGRKILPVIAWSLGMWFFMCLVFYLALAAFPTGETNLAGLMGLSGAIFLQVLICAGVAAPSAPGFFGVWQFAARLAFIPWPEAEPAAVGAFAILAFLVSYLCTIVLGLEAFRNEGVKWEDVKSVSGGDEGETA